MAGSGVYAQEAWLEHIGGTEVELMVFLDFDSDSPLVRRYGRQLTVEKKDVNAVYQLTHGKVTRVTYRQTFTSNTVAGTAFDRAMKFLHKRGLRFDDIKEKERYRLVHGSGNGFRTTLILSASDDRIQLNAEVVAMQ